MSALEENFKTEKGGSYGIPGVMDYGVVDEFLKGEGYSIGGVLSKGRYYILRLEKEGLKSLFKMSSSLDINEALRNEKSWNIELQPHALETTFLRIPKVIGSAEINSLQYIITEFFEGERFVETIKNGSSRDIEEGLKKVVLSNIYIDSQKDIKTYKNTVEDESNQAYKSVKEKASKYYTVAENFLKEVSGYELTGLLELVKGYEQMDEIGLCHNEFEPYNFIYSSDLVNLYHGERASARSPRFFDVAVMYSKLYYTLSKPELANLYLKAFLKEYSGDTEYFKFSFITMLASRVIGGYWDYNRNYENDISMLERCRKQILGNTIFKL